MSDALKLSHQVQIEVCTRNIVEGTPDAVIREKKTLVSYAT